MTVEELSGAVLVREGNEDVFEYDLPEVDSDNGTDDGTGAQDPLVADILEPCGQFVELRQRPYGHQRNVHLVHETVREFLVSQLSTWPVWGNEGLGPTLAAEGLKLGNEPPSIEEAQHRILGRLCLWFVQSRSMWQLASLGDDVYEFQTWAFGDYAAACWDRHLASYTPLERDDATLQRIIDFMDATNTSWEAWQCWSANGCWIEDRGGTASSAVELRLYAVAATLIRQMSPGDEELCSARLLINCCRQGHVGLVDQVLDAGAYIDAAGIRGLTALHEAASRGYYDVVSRLVARGASVDPVANLGRTPLFYALRGGHLEIIGLLTDNGAKVTWDDSLMSNLIQHLAVNHAPDTVQFLMERAEVQANYLPHIAVAAAAAGNLDLLQCLLDKGVDICQNDNELPPLKMAVKNDHMETVAFLLAKGADVDGVTSRFSEQVMSDISIMRYASVKVSSSVGCSAMNIAIEADNLAMVRLLADAGADLDRLDISGCGPVHTAAMYGRLDILKLLAERGADMGAVLRRRRTVLHFAAEGGHLDVVAYLITCADAVRIDAVDDHGRTAVGLAAFRSNLDIARFLLSKGAGFSKIDKGTRFINKYHRNSKASSAPSAEAVSLLIENGADFNAADKHGMTGLDYAARIARLDLVEVLVDNGADVTRTDHHGRTAIHHAASYYTWWWRRLTPATLQKAVAQIIDLLLDHGADVDAADADGRTALHAAALKNGLTPIHRLCKRGANVNAVCAGGSTPLHLAAEKNNLHVVRALVRRGADTTIKNDDGETALDVAKRRGREAVVEYLEGLTRESGQDVHLQGP